MIKLYYFHSDKKIKKGFSQTKVVSDKIGCTIYKSKNGKPQIDGGYVSVAHCKNIAVIALSDRPVGVDIERIKAYNKLIKSIVPERDKIYDNKSFFEMWTAKEAYLKAHGGKLMQVLKNVRIDSVKDYTFNSFIYNNSYVVTTCEKKE